MTELIEIKKRDRNINIFEELAAHWSKFLNYPLTSSQVIVMLLEFKITQIKNEIENYDTIIHDMKYLSYLKEIIFGKY